MANPEHVEIVKRGKEAVSAYYKSRINTEEPLEWDLSYEDFRGEKFEGIAFNNANLKGANFINARFLKCSFENCELNDQDFENSASFADAIFTDCYFFGMDLLPESFHEATFSISQFESGSFKYVEYNERDFSDCEFNNYEFKDCTLKHTAFNSKLLKNTKFISCNLEESNFGTGSLNIEFTKCNVTNSDLSGLDFSSCQLTKNDFTNSNFRGVDFSNSNLQCSIFDNSNLEAANFYEADVSLVNFKNSRNLEKAINLDKAHVDKLKTGNVKYFDYCIRKLPEKWCDWEKLRIFGKLPLFGASYAALIFIPLFFYFLAIYNDKVDIVKIWAKQTVSMNHSDPLALLLIDRLQPLPVPNLSLVLLLSTLCLAIASSIYALVCPSRIKEFSKDQWTDQLGHSLVHYWALSWKYRKTRLTCLFFYIFGGIGVLWVIGNKVFNVAVFIFNNSQMTF